MAKLPCPDFATAALMAVAPSVSSPDDLPVFPAETMVHAIAGTRTSVELILISGGTLATRDGGQYVKRQIDETLIGLLHDARVFQNKLSTWKSRIYKMEEARNILDGMIRSEAGVTDTERIVFMDDHTNQTNLNNEYIKSFIKIQRTLQRIRDELRALYDFLNKICREGNELSPVTDGDTTDEDTISMQASTERPTNLSEFYPTQQAYESRPPTRPPPNTPSWKLDLQHSYTYDNLFVGAAELRAFRNASARISHIGPILMDTMNDCKEAQALGVEMQGVWREWKLAVEKGFEAESQKLIASIEEGEIEIGHSIDGTTEEFINGPTPGISNGLGITFNGTNDSALGISNDFTNGTTNSTTLDSNGNTNGTSDDIPSGLTFGLGISNGGTNIITVDDNGNASPYISPYP